MTIPVYVLTGFLDSGKTTFLNTLLNKKEQKNTNTLVIQFETGEEKFFSLYNNNFYDISFSKKVLEQQPETIINEILNTILNRPIDEMWIEWNGVVPFSQLQDLLLHPSLRSLCKIQKSIHIADADSIENLLGRTGAALPEQIANSDFIVVRNMSSTTIYKRMSRLMKGINPGVEIYDTESYKDLSRKILKKNEHPVNAFLLSLVILVCLYFAGQIVFEAFQIPFSMIINIFLGIILQAIPFLLIGVLLSSLIQVFVPQSFIERRFPKSLGMGMLVAILSGFCLPVCDCASIPIFRSLVKKGIPLPVATTFMTATPVINPVVIISTYYAFNGNLKMVITRVVLGIIAAIIIGLVTAYKPPKDSVLSGGAIDRLMCSCGCYEDAQSITTLGGKMDLFIRHSQAEFFDVGKYLLLGTFVASSFQVLGTDMINTSQSGAGLALSIIIMMIMAFVLSLCSSSDAIIARSLARQFPMGAIMGFLVFGPMMDIKNDAFFRVFKGVHRQTFSYYFHRMLHFDICIFNVRRNII